jgi:hypothetical protein
LSIGARSIYIKASRVSIALVRCRSVCGSVRGADRSPRLLSGSLWGKINAFDQAHPFYRTLKAIAQVRATQPALRYGRQYFRQLSGNRQDFSISPFTPGVIAFSRILNAQEVLVVANTAEQGTFQGEVVVDKELNRGVATFRLLFSNLGNPTAPGPLRLADQGTVSITEADGGITNGPARVLQVTVQPLEVQVLRAS